MKADQGNSNCLARQPGLKAAGGDPVSREATAEVKDFAPGMVLADDGRLQASGPAGTNNGWHRAAHPGSVASDLSHVCFVGVEPPARCGVRRQPSRVGPAESGERNKRAGFFRARSDSPLSPAALCEAEEPDAFLVWLFNEAGLDAGAYRCKALQRRLPACLRALRASCSEQARAMLERRPELLPRAMEAVLIGVSGFFRDQAVFEQLRRSVLPNLLRGRGGLSVYSAGSADGRELYSMAMLLDGLGVLKGSSLLGVDCRPEAIARAEAGWYGATDLDGVAPELRDRYFEPHGTRACIRAALRGNICWQVGNLLIASQAGGGWDVVLCRNVAIYLRPEQTAGLWERLTAGLRPGGVLVTGKAERPTAGLPLKRIYPSIYQKRAER